MKTMKWTKGIAALLSVVCLGTVCACDNSSEDGDVAGLPTTTSVWTTYNSMKVMQNSAMNGNYAIQNAKISASMAKNELESAQLFVTAGNKDIRSFDLVAGDLTNANGDKITTDNISIYAQKYIEVSETWEKPQHTKQE